MKNSSSSQAAPCEDAGNLARGYERLRMEVLERQHVAARGAGRSVLHRQGMSAWMRLCPVKPPSERYRPESAAQPSAPVRSELLSALTDLVFQTWNRRS